MYTGVFYDNISAGCQQSAQVVVPIVSALTEPTSVIDVGGGDGWWAKEFLNNGATSAIVLDSASAISARSTQDGDKTYTLAGVEFHPHDITEHLDVAETYGRFSLAVCLEVAEHVPSRCAAGLVETLTSASDVILFSAAVPGQGGVNHINEQWPPYWAELFEAHGYAMSGALRWMVWDDPRVEPWYRQNLMIVAKNPQWHRYRSLFDTPMAMPWSVVHPTILQWARGV